MKWEHKCDLKWLKARQNWLTASDIKKLLPVTKTGRPRKVSELDYVGVMASKMVELTEEDCWSYGAMARGHLLEPYAVDALNQALVDTRLVSDWFWHWDDVVVTLPNRDIAFSPDAMDIAMGDPIENATAIAEIKSYSPDRHLVCGYTPKDQLEERWQIATAMALLENIDHAWLVFFNPKMIRRLIVIRYDRADLAKEIETVLGIEKSWHDFKADGILTRDPDDGFCSARGDSEATIEAEIEKANRLNP